MHTSKTRQLLLLLTALLLTMPSLAQKVRVACVGNSITYGANIGDREKYHYPAQLQGYLGDGFDVRNFGMNGATLLRQGDRPYVKSQQYQQSLEFLPDIVLIKLGTNDTKDYNWKGKKAFANDLEKMMKTLQALPSQPKIYLCAPIPAFKPSWTINEKVIVDEVIPTLEKAVKKYGLAGFIDLHSAFEGQEDLILPDGIHPNGNGARKIAETVAKVIDPDVVIPQGGRFPWMN